jgi:pimeloyl-ACP methyl ester carboxylesterase
MVTSKHSLMAHAVLLSAVFWRTAIAQAETDEADVEVVQAEAARTGNTFATVYSIPGLPQQDFLLNQNYSNGIVQAIRFKGTRGYLIQPARVTDPKRRWIWVSPLWVAFNSPTWGDSFLRPYVESALDAGFHVAGLDVGTTCGSPKGAELYDEFFTWIVPRFDLNSKARMVGVSNGGLITYAWAFRHAQRVDRILGIYPATDMRTWPGLDKVCGAARLPPAGLAFPYGTVGELEAHLSEVNPVSNLQPLVKAGVRIFQVHGDKDALVPLAPNSSELKQRYRALGGDIQLEVLEGEGHGGNAFFPYEPAVKFLLAED